MNDLKVRGEEVNGVRAIFSAGVIAAYYNVSFRGICDYVLWSVCEWLALFQNVFLVLVDEYFRNAIKIVLKDYKASTYSYKCVD